MPELPEVEIAARNLRRWLSRRRIQAVEVHDPRSLAHTREKDLAGLVGLEGHGVDRRGKNLLLQFGTGRSKAVGLWSHLGMTGKWVRRPTAADRPRFARVSFALADDSLHFCDARLFGFLRVVPDADFAAQPGLQALGPDALDAPLVATDLRRRLSRLRRPIKVALLDQALIAGLGNIQANEALFIARLDPRRSASSLTLAETRRLLIAIGQSLRRTLKTFEAAGADRDRDIAYVEEPGTPNPFWVYGRGGQRCPRCRRATIQRVVQAGRSTFFCPRCLESKKSAAKSANPRERIPRESETEPEGLRERD